MGVPAGARLRSRVSFMVARAFGKAVTCMSLFQCRGLSASIAMRPREQAGRDKAVPSPTAQPAAPVACVQRVSHYAATVVAEVSSRMKKNCPVIHLGLFSGTARLYV